MVEGMEGGLEEGMEAWVEAWKLTMTFSPEGNQAPHLQYFLPTLPLLCFHVTLSEGMHSWSVYLFGVSVATNEKSCLKLSKSRRMFIELTSSAEAAWVTRPPHAG